MRNYQFILILSFGSVLLSGRAWGNTTCYDSDGSPVTITKGTCDNNTQNDNNQEYYNTQQEASNAIATTIVCQDSNNATYQSTADKGCNSGDKPLENKSPAVSTLIQADKQNLTSLGQQMDVARAKEKAACAKDQSVPQNQQDCLTAGDNETTAENKYKDAEKKYASDQKTNGYFNDIGTKDDAKQGDCGKYGGADCGITKLVNQYAPIVDNVMGQAGSNSVNAAGSAANQSLVAQGANVTQTQVNNAQASVIDKAKKAETDTMHVDMAIGSYQLVRTAQHLMSIHNIKNTQSAAISHDSPAFKEAKNSLIVKNNCGKKSETNANPDCEDASLNTQAEGIINSNAAIEIANQQKTAASAFMDAIQTAASVNKHLQNRNADSQAMAEVAATNTSTGGGFYLTNTTSGTTTAPNNMPSQTSSVLAATATNTSTAGGLGNSPVIPNNALNATATPTQFIPSAALSQGGGSNGGLGSAGGTSAAKDDASKNQADAPSKSQMGGSYALGDGSSGYKRGGSNGSGVGVDSGLLDMMKKLLDDKKDLAENKPNIEDPDRAPASDQAAVLGRNQNIFEAIHKRYQKKNTEGAVIFGDQT